MSHTNSSLTRWQGVRLQTGICLASFLGCLDFTIVNTALPAIQRSFAADMASVQWVMTLFVMALCCCMVLAARLAERYGRPQVLYAGMLLFALASLGAGLSPNLACLNLCRLLQGAACAVLYTATAAILVDALPPARHGRALGLLFAANGIGLALGPVAGGVLVSLAGWQSVFLLNVPLIALSFACCRTAVRARRPAIPLPVDLRGWLLLVAGLVPLLLWTVRVPQWGALSAPSLLLLALAVILLLLFGVAQRRSRHPLIAFAVLRSAAFRRACAVSMLLAVFYCSAFMLMPFRLIALYHPSDAQLGLWLLPVTLVMALVSPLAGRWSDRAGPWPVLAVGFIMLAASALLQSAFSSGLWTGWVLLAFALMGVGWGAVLGPSVTAALQALPAHLHAQGIGLPWTLHNLAGALGLAVVTQLYQVGGADAGYQWVMWGLAGLAAGGAVIALYGCRADRASVRAAQG